MNTLKSDTTTDNDSPEKAEVSSVEQLRKELSKQTGAFVDGLIDHPEEFDTKPYRPEYNEPPLYKGTGVCEQAEVTLKDGSHIRYLRARETDELALDPERVFTSYTLQLSLSSADRALIITSDTSITKATQGVYFAEYADAVKNQKNDVTRDEDGLQNVLLMIEMAEEVARKSDA